MSPSESIRMPARNGRAPIYHPLETFLAKRSVRRFLRLITASRPGSAPFMERWFRNYENPDMGWFRKLCWALPNAAISLALRKTGVNKESMKRNLFHHVPTVKALVVTARGIARYGLTAPQRFPAPLFVVWNITQACNLACRHCYQTAGPKPAADEMTLAQKLAAVDRLADASVPFLAIAGGEPMATPDLWPVLERARKREIHVSLATNGTMLTPQNVARLIDGGVKYIEVSVDSLDPEQHDRFRGVAGAWKRSVQGIRNSVAAGMRTGMAMCFTRETVDFVDEAVDFAIGLGCRTFSHFNFIPVGKGVGMVEEDMTPAQREFLVRRLAARLQEDRINIISTAPQFARACVCYAPTDGLFAVGHAGASKGPKTAVLSRYVGGCGCGRCYCAVQPNGIVTPCVYIPSIVLGDLRRQTVPEIWSHPLMAQLSDRGNLGEHCGVCDYLAYCGGCRARALAYTGDILHADPGCGYNAQQWDEVASHRRSTLVRIASEGRE